MHWETPAAEGEPLTGGPASAILQLSLPALGLLAGPCANNATIRLIPATLRCGTTLPGDMARLRRVSCSDLITLTATVCRAEGWMVTAADTLRSRQFVLKAFSLKRQELKAHHLFFPETRVMVEPLSHHSYQEPFSPSRVFSLLCSGIGQGLFSQLNAYKALNDNRQKSGNCGS